MPFLVLKNSSTAFEVVSSFAPISTISRRMGATSSGSYGIAASYRGPRTRPPGNLPPPMPPHLQKEADWTK